MRDTKVLILQFLVTAKHIKVFETVIFLKTVVLLKYIKPNTALVFNRPFAKLQKKKRAIVVDFGRQNVKCYDTVNFAATLVFLCY